MPLEVDYLPFAVSGVANVDSQSDFAGSSYQENGFAPNSVPAQSKQLNKVWRQSSMFAAALAQFISNTLQINVLDDGNLSNLLANYQAALVAMRMLSTQVSAVGSNLAFGGISSSAIFGLANFSIPANTFSYVGKTLKITATGVIDIAAVSQTTELAFYLGNPGASTISPAVGLTSSSNSILGWEAFLYLVCAATGSAGALQAFGDIQIGVVPTSKSINQTNLGLSSVDLAAPVTIGLQGQFSVSNASNEMSQQVLLVEALN